MRPQLICITGGIGSGKSVVCRLLHSMGYDIYDCDSRARLLMEQSEKICKRIAECFSQELITLTDDNRRSINRAMLANIVFNDKEKLNLLNSIVHAEVRADIMEWVKQQSGISSKPLFIESAIAYTSGLDKMVDKVWRVYAPMSLRVRRAMMRDNATELQIIGRIESQKNDEYPAAKSSEQIIVNDGGHPLIPQITQLIATLKQKP